MEIVVLLEIKKPPGIGAVQRAICFLISNLPACHALPRLPCSGGFPPPDLLSYNVEHPVLSVFLRAPFADADAETGKVEKVDELLKAYFVGVVLDR